MHHYSIIQYRSKSPESTKLVPEPARILSISWTIQILAPSSLQGAGLGPPSCILKTLAPMPIHNFDGEHLINEALRIPGLHGGISSCHSVRVMAPHLQQRSLALIPALKTQNPRIWALRPAAGHFPAVTLFACNPHVQFSTNMKNQTTTTNPKWIPQEKIRKTPRPKFIQNPKQ